MSLHDEIQEQKEKNKLLSPKKRFENFLHYNKYYIIVGAVAVLILLYLIWHIFFNRELPYGFTAYTFNSNYYLAQDLSPVDNLMHDYADYAKLDTSANQVFMKTDISMKKEQVDNYEMALDMSLVVDGERERIDVLIANSAVIDSFIVNNFYSSTMEDLLPADLYDYFETNQLLYYYTDEADGKKYPIGIYVQQAEKFKDISLYDDTEMPILAIVSLSPRTDNSIAFIRYIFNLPSTQ